MTSISLQQDYLELLNLVKKHIAQEFSAGQLVVAEKETFEYFKQKLVSKNNKSPQAQISAATHTPTTTKAQPLAPAKIAPISQHSYFTPVKPAAHLGEKEEQSRLTNENLNCSVAQTAQEPTSFNKPPTLTPGPSLNLPSVEKGLSLEKKKFQRASIQAGAISDFNDMKKFFAEKFPHIPIIDTPPSDMEAKAFSNQWQRPQVIADVVILSFDEPIREKHFLNSLAHAIATEICSAGILSAEKIEIDNTWESIFNKENVRLIIGYGAKMELYPNLMKFYREEQVNAARYLGKTPLYLLPDISLYFQEPKLKMGLWHSLCKQLKIKL